MSTGTGMASTGTSYRSGLRPGRDGFAQVLRAEWTKFRTVRGWVTGMALAVVVMDLVGLLAAGSAGFACNHGPGTPTQTGRACIVPVPTGPGGEGVSDSFYFVHQPLAGNGTITTRITSLTGRYEAGNGPAGQGPSLDHAGLQPWSKAGIIIKASTREGSAYTAMVVTGRHGVRMQYDYTGDIAGHGGLPSAAAPRWLRLARSGDTITGYESADGAHWTRVGAAHLAGLPRTVQAGLFATSPPHTVASQHFGGENGQVDPSQATAVFDHLSLAGPRPGRGWAGQDMGAEHTALGGQFHQASGVFTMTGSGDIAPVVNSPGSGVVGPSATIEQHLIGAFAGLIAVAVVATLFITAEYRRGLIRTTLAASPRRGRVLAAKAIVIGAASFVAGLIAAVIAVPVGSHLARSQGIYVFPVSWLTALRVVAGTAALLAVAAVLALALGTVLRRSAAAVTAVIVAIVLPYILGVASVLPAGAAGWVLRLTPAAAFAIQQSIPQYSQVTAQYTPGNGYFPLAPWAGFAVLCGYTAIAVGVAVHLLRRRDA
jgi:ABC-type transport system involved in multi-copper enzyme maturation permease subunit